jgi:hypothetical protein
MDSDGYTRTLVVSKEANMVYVKHKGSYDQGLRMEAFRQVVEHQDFVPGMCLIADLREVDLSTFSSEDNQMLATAAEKLSEAFVGTRLALIVSPRAADYGIMRQFELMVADPREGKDRLAGPVGPGLHPLCRRLQVAAPAGSLRRDEARADPLRAGRT